MQLKHYIRLSSHLAAILITVIPLISCGRVHDQSPTAGVSTLYTSAPPSNGNGTPDDAISGSRRNAITNAVKKASPAVVGINVTEIREQRYYDPFADDPFFQQFFGRQQNGYTQRYEVKELGSGFIISKDGYILTNDHVAGNASKIIVTLSGGAKYDATLVATDHTSDVTLLKIKGENLPYLKLGSSSDLIVGEWAIAMGNPFGLFSLNNKPTVTVGVISNTGVSLGIQDGRNYREMIQTDAAISSGNSGGPLLNANGDVIGINATIISTSQGYQGAGSIGLGFAIPIDKVKKLVDDFRAGRHVDHSIGDLGFRYNALTDEVRQYFKIKNEDGVVVTDMRRNSVAHNAGLQVGDVITAVDHQAIRGPEDLQSILADHVVGDQVTFDGLRDDKKISVSLELPAKAR